MPTGRDNAEMFFHNEWCVVVGGCKPDLLPHKIEAFAFNM